MIKEYKRREENKKELLRQQKEKEEQKRLRKEQRAAARERHRIGLLLEKITANTIGTATQEDFVPSTTKIYDIRDPEAKKDGINVIGGLMGELIITFTCLLDYILANPQNQNFNFTVEAIEAFLKDLLIQEGFADGSLIVHLTQHPVPNAEVGQDFSGLEEEHFIKFAQQRANIADYGLSFLFDVMKDLVINADFINILYHVIAKTVKTKLKQHVPIPEMPGPDAEGNEPSDDDKAAAQKKIDEATKTNQDIDKHNDEVTKMRSKIQLGLRAAVSDANMPEVALLRLLNFREAKLDESSFINQSQENIASKSARGDQPGDNQESTASLENFSLEDLPTKMIIVDQKIAEDIHLIAYHAGKTY